MVPIESDLVCSLHLIVNRVIASALAVPANESRLSWQRDREREKGRKGGREMERQEEREEERENELRVSWQRE